MDLNEKIKELYASYTLNELACMFNTTHVSIYNWICGKKISKKKKREIQKIIESLELEKDGDKDVLPSEKTTIKELKGLSEFMKMNFDESLLHETLTEKQLEKLKEIKAKKETLA